MRRMFAALALVAMLAPACADARRAGDHPTPPPDGDPRETVFTLHARGVDRTVRVYALMDLDRRPPGMSDEYAARRSLLDLVDALGSLERWLPEGSVSPSRTYRPAGSRVFVSSYRGEPDLRQPEIAWPLEPLARLREDTGTGIRCATVTGSDWADRLAPAARSANQLTPWTSDGRRYAIAFRPLLPDGSGC